MQNETMRHQDGLEPKNFCSRQHGHDVKIKPKKSYYAATERRESSSL
jgi:hypothetical protein